MGGVKGRVRRGAGKKSPYTLKATDEGRQVGRKDSLGSSFLESTTGGKKPERQKEPYPKGKRKTPYEKGKNEPSGPQKTQRLRIEEKREKKNVFMVEQDPRSERRDRGVN